jgi:hypothetical protein
MEPLIRAQYSSLSLSYVTWLISFLDLNSSSFARYSASGSSRCLVVGFLPRPHLYAEYEETVMRPAIVSMYSGKGRLEANEYCAVEVTIA